MIIASKTIIACLIKPVSNDRQGTPLTSEDSGFFDPIRNLIMVKKPMIYGPSDPVLVLLTTAVLTDQDVKQKNGGV